MSKLFKFKTWNMNEDEIKEYVVVAESKYDAVSKLHSSEDVGEFDDFEFDEDFNEENVKVIL